MSSTTIFSTDSHVIEPPDLWAGKVDAAYRDRTPRLVPEAGGDWWHVEGERVLSVNGGTHAGVRFQDPKALKLEARWAEVIAGAYQPQAKLKDMDTDGIQGEVIYPTLGMHFFRIPDAGLARNIMRVYNDWLAEFCKADPKRLKAVALICLDDIPLAIAELTRAAKAGLCGAMISVYPSAERSYDRPEYEAFWAAAAEMAMPLSLHIATNRTLPPAARTTEDRWSTKVLNTPTAYVTAVNYIEMSLADMLFSGVFERFPKLRFVSLEYEAGWAPYLIEMMDYTYTQRARRANWYRFKDGVLPGDLFRQCVAISFQEDALAIKLRQEIGVDNLVWGSDYPHQESTFPRSREILDKVLAGVPQMEQEKIRGGNAARLYRF